MACACKVNEQIGYLQKKYGHKIPTSKKSILGFRFKETLKALLIYLLVIPLLPLMLLHVLYVSIFKKDKTINVKELLRLKQV